MKTCSNKGPCVAGIDMGTHGLKAILFDLDGQILAAASRSYELSSPKPGWAEQRADDWWEALQGAMTEAIARSQISSAQIAAVGIACQRYTTVPVDRQFKPVRTAILWCDSRAQKEIAWAKDILGTDACYRRTGSPPDTSCPYPKWLWVKKNEPQIYENVQFWMSPHDYLVHQLTGEIATSAATSASTSVLDLAKMNGWAHDILKKLNLKAETLPPIVAAGAIIGEVHERAANATGLAKGTPVIAGSGDQPSGSLGAGVVTADLLSINLGTSCILNTLSSELILHPEIGYLIEVSPRGKYVPEASIRGGTRTIEWFLDAFLHVPGKAQKEQLTKLTAEAGKADPGSLGLMVIPYWSGAKQPYWDLGARGIMLGFGFAHTRGHIFRAILEGLAYEIHRNLIAIETGTRSKIREIRVYGGGAKNTLWKQIIADVNGLPACTLNTIETTSLGMAISGALTTKLFGSLEEAVQRMVKKRETFRPCEVNHRLYRELYEGVYRDFYGRIKDLLHKSSEITGYYP